MAATDVVRARIDKQVKAEASAALAAMGLSMSDAIRLLMVRVAQDKALPFEIKLSTPPRGSHLERPPHASSR